MINQSKQIGAYTNIQQLLKKLNGKIRRLNKLDKDKEIIAHIFHRNIHIFIDLLQYIPHFGTHIATYIPLSFGFL